MATQIKNKDIALQGANKKVIYNNSTLPTEAPGLEYDSATGATNMPIAGTPTTLTAPAVQITNSVDNYTQVAIQNKSTGTNSSADMIVYPDNMTTDTSGFMDMGVTGSAFVQAAYAILSANDGYLFSSAVSGASKPGNMIIATDSTGTSNEVRMFTNGFSSTANERVRINATLAKFFQALEVVGTLTVQGTKVDIRQGRAYSLKKIGLTQY
jgi:hypothetical protein